MFNYRQILSYSLCAALPCLTGAKLHSPSPPAFAEWTEHDGGSSSLGIAPTNVHWRLIVAGGLLTIMHETWGDGEQPSKWDELDIVDVQLGDIAKFTRDENLFDGGRVYEIGMVTSGTTANWRHGNGHFVKGHINWATELSPAISMQGLPGQMQFDGSQKGLRDSIFDRLCRLIHQRD